MIFSRCLFFWRPNSLALSHALKQIKYKSRVGVDDSWTLMGVMDEFGCLGEKEICVCLKDENDRSVRYLSGNTLVTRMPALHCGDVQQVRAIGSLDASNPLSALYNCIAFSSKGSCPVPKYALWRRFRRRSIPSIPKSLTVPANLRRTRLLPFNSSNRPGTRVYDRRPYSRYHEIE